MLVRKENDGLWGSLADTAFTFFDRSNFYQGATDSQHSKLPREQKVTEGQESEFIGIINYCIMALIQLEKGVADQPDLTPEETLGLYDKHLQHTKDLMLAKNHD